MNYLKNVDICKLYGVSPATPVRWIKQAKIGKNELKLVEVDGKHRIEDTPQNHVILERMTKAGEKFINSGDIQHVKPNFNFYKYHSVDEIARIYFDLQDKKEINLKYAYHGDGAMLWNEVYIEKTYHQEFYKYKHLRTLDSELEDIFSYLDPSKKINIIDIGCGNGLPILKTLDGFINKGFDIEYIPLDISQECLNITFQNVQSRFPNLKISPSQMDIPGKDFYNLNYKLRSQENTTNIYVLLDEFGGDDSIFSNFTSLTEFVSEMSQNDILIFDLGLNIIEKAYPNLSMANINKGNWQMNKLKLLGIENEFLDTEIIYKPETRTRYKLLRPKKDFEISIEVFGNTKKIILPKSVPVKVWSYRLFNLDEIYNGFNQSKLVPIILKIDKENGGAFAVCKPIKGMRFA